METIPGTLKPAALSVLAILEHARGRRMSAAKIFEKLAGNASSGLLWDMYVLGLVRRDTNDGPQSRHVWRLEVKLAVRP